MIKMKKILYDEIEKLHECDANLYVGDISDIKKSMFDTDNLYVASLVCFFIQNDKLNRREVNFKYIVEMDSFTEDDEDTVYADIFSDSRMQKIDFSKLFSLRGIYVSKVISYNEYVSSLTQTDKKEMFDDTLKDENQVKIRKRSL